jgi:holo-[acyl-carrier protein] synthase
MIIGIGIDNIEIERIDSSIQTHGDHFLNKIFTPLEKEYCQSKSTSTARFALRFAAKEAFFKALGTGFTKGVSWHEVEVQNDDAGKPFLNIRGQSLDLLLDKTGGKSTKIHLSLSDTDKQAMAFVIIEC